MSLPVAASSATMRSRTPVIASGSAQHDLVFHRERCRGELQVSLTA
jgi:hypothetical protein